jgi:DNA-directed RNA polymerase specialized sigma24 family protein
MNPANSTAIEAAQPLRRPAAFDLLKERIELLDRDDQILLELTLSTNVSQRRIAEMLGVEPGTVTRRLQRLSRRLHDPLVVRLLDPRCPLGPDYRQIGVEHFLAGRSVADIAQRLGRTRASVRMTVENVRAWHHFTRATSTQRAEP